MQLVAKETREFHAMHRMISRDQGFQGCFVRQFSVDLRKWEKCVLETTFTTKRDKATYPAPFWVPPKPKPDFGSTRRFLKAAPI